MFIFFILLFLDNNQQTITNMASKKTKIVKRKQTISHHPLIKIIDVGKNKILVEKTDSKVEIRFEGTGPGVGVKGYCVKGTGPGVGVKRYRLK